MPSIVRTITLVIAAAALALPTAAGAQSTAPILDQYGNPSAASGETPSTTPPGSSGGGASTPDTNGQAAESQPVANVVETRAAATTPAETVGALPFTGAELSILFFAGLALLGSGAVLRRVGYARRRRARD
jgi:hypothetical protein